MSTDDNQPLDGSPAPFARRPMTWGRPPATVFRAGPLPKGERLPPLPEPPAASPPRQPRAGAILSGSMIPQAAPASRPAPIPTPSPVPAPAAPLAETPLRPSLRAPEPDLTVRPLPPLPEIPEPRPRPAPAEAALRPSLRAPEPDLTVRPLPPLPEIPEPRPRPAPAEAAPVVRAAPVAAHVAASATRRPAGRMSLYAGAAAAVLGVVAVGGWMLTRSPAVAPVVEASVPAPEAVETASTVEAAPLAEQRVIEATPAPAVSSVRTAPARVSPPASTRTAVQPDAVRQPAPAPYQGSTPAPTSAAAPAPAVATEPLIEIVPPAPAGPPPTAAERPPADPDTPIATRPQPLN